MIYLLHLALVLNSHDTWIMSRAIMYSGSHDHSSITFPRCLRNNAHVRRKLRWCRSVRKAEDCEACEYIVHDSTCLEVCQWP